MKSIPVFIGKGLDSPILVEFQASLVVVLECHLEVLNAGAEGGSSQRRPTMTQQCHTFPLCMVNSGSQLSRSNSTSISHGRNGGMGQTSTSAFGGSMPPLD